MTHSVSRSGAAALLLAASVATLAAPQAARLGAFSQATDVGEVSRPLEASHEPATGVYTLSAGGENIWGSHDAFGFVWKSVRGELAFGTRVEIASGGHAHRKAGIMLRQSLDADSPYVDAVVHGDGLTSLQFRLEAGGPTREIQCATRAPALLRLEKRGDYVFLSLANPEGSYDSSGCVVRIALRGNFYAGLVACAHDDSAVVTARFRHVTLGTLPGRPKAITYALELIDRESLDRRVLAISRTRIDAASFTANGEAICYRDEGNVMRLALTPGAEPVPIDPADAAACEVAFAPGIRSQDLPAAAARRARAWLPRRSPDGLNVAYLLASGRGDGPRPEAGDYVLATIAAGGGEPEELARFHGDHGALGLAPWSKDGAQLVFVSREPD